MSPPKNNAKTALIVEDSPTQAMRLEGLLAENGMNVVWARNGEEGLHLAQTRMPDIIILDVELPGMNGMQLAKYLKDNKYTHSIPIVLLTILDYRETAKYGVKAEAINFIPKDAFADSVLLETLRQRGLIDKAEVE
jgi:two-component system cell cycle response regulator